MITQLSYEEAVHKLLKVKLDEGQEVRCQKMSIQKLTLITD